MWFLGWPPTYSNTASSSRGIPHLHPGHRRVQPMERTVRMLAASQAVCPKGPPEPPKDPRTLPVLHSDPRGPRVAQRTVHVTHLDSRVPSNTQEPPCTPHCTPGPSMNPTEPQVGLRLDQPFPFETMGPTQGTQVGQSQAGREGLLQGCPGQADPPPSSIFCCPRATSAGFGKLDSGPGPCSEARMHRRLSGKGHGDSTLGCTQTAEATKDLLLQAPPTALGLPGQDVLFTPVFLSVWAGSP